MPIAELNGVKINVKVRTGSIFIGAGGSTGGGSGGASRLDQLGDVVEIAPHQGDTLVYDQSSDTYRVETPSMDGGTF